MAQRRKNATSYLIDGGGIEPGLSDGEEDVLRIVGKGNGQDDSNHVRCQGE